VLGVISLTVPGLKIKPRIENGKLGVTVTGDFAAVPIEAAKLLAGPVPTDFSVDMIGGRSADNKSATGAASVRFYGNLPRSVFNALTEALAGKIPAQALAVRYHLLVALSLIDLNS